MLQPWRGARAAGGGKRERVQGLTPLRDSKSQDVGKDARGMRGPSGLRATLWRQGNARASRKVVLPLVLGAVKKALGV